MAKHSHLIGCHGDIQHAAAMHVKLNTSPIVAVMVSVLVAVPVALLVAVLVDLLDPAVQALHIL